MEKLKEYLDLKNYQYLDYKLLEDYPKYRSSDEFPNSNLLLELGHIVKKLGCTEKEHPHFESIIEFTVLEKTTVLEQEQINDEQKFKITFLKQLFKEFNDYNLYFSESPILDRNIVVNLSSDIKDKINNGTLQGITSIEKGNNFGIDKKRFTIEKADFNASIKPCIVEAVRRIPKINLKEKISQLPVYFIINNKYAESVVNHLSIIIYLKNKFYSFGVNGFKKNASLNVFDEAIRSSKNKGSWLNLYIQNENQMVEELEKFNKELQQIKTVLISASSNENRFIQDLEEVIMSSIGKKLTSNTDSKDNEEFLQFIREKKKKKIDTEEELTKAGKKYQFQKELLEHTSDKLKKKEYLRLMKKFVRKDGKALQFVSEELKKDSDFVLTSVMNDGKALQFVSKELQEDSETYRKIVLTSVRNDGNALQFVSKELQEDSEIVLASVKNDGNALELVSEKLQEDRETYKKIVLASVKNDGNALKFVSEELKKDREVVMEADNWIIKNFLETKLKKIVPTPHMNNKSLINLSNKISCTLRSYIYLLRVRYLKERLQDYNQGKFQVQELIEELDNLKNEVNIPSEDYEIGDKVGYEQGPDFNFGVIINKDKGQYQIISDQLGELVTGINKEQIQKKVYSQKLVGIINNLFDSQNKFKTELKDKEIENDLNELYEHIVPRLETKRMKFISNNVGSKFEKNDLFGNRILDMGILTEFHLVRINKILQSIQDLKIEFYIQNLEEAQNIKHIKLNKLFLIRLKEKYKLIQTEIHNPLSTTSLTKTRQDWERNTINKQMSLVIEVLKGNIDDNQMEKMLDIHKPVPNNLNCTTFVEYIFENILNCSIDKQVTMSDEVLMRISNNSTILKKNLLTSGVSLTSLLGVKVPFACQRFKKKISSNAGRFVFEFSKTRETLKFEELKNMFEVLKEGKSIGEFLLRSNSTIDHEKLKDSLNEVFYSGKEECLTTTNSEKLKTATPDQFFFDFSNDNMVKPTKEKCQEENQKILKLEQIKKVFDGAQGGSKKKTNITTPKYSFWKHTHKKSKLQSDSSKKRKKYKNNILSRKKN